MQKQVEKALEYARKWRVTVNVNKCAVLFCDEDKENPVESKWRWGEVDYLGVEIEKKAILGTVTRSKEKGEAQIGKTRSSEARTAVLGSRDDI